MQSILWANEVFVPFIIAGARAMSSSIDALVGFIHGSMRFLPQAFLFGKKKEAMIMMVGMVDSGCSKKRAEMAY